MNPPRIRTRVSPFISLLLLLSVEEESHAFSAFSLPSQNIRAPSSATSLVVRWGWVQGDDGEWEWEEGDPDYVPPATTTTIQPEESSATPTLPSGSFRPKQSLGQNFLKDGNTVAKMLRAFHKDATLSRQQDPEVIIELGPGAGALTDQLVKTYGTDVLQCIEVDPRSVELLEEKHPFLTVYHEDVLQVDYPAMAESQGQPLIVVGNLPYYITSQILFALADASHFGAVDCATVTMQWEVAQRMVAPTRCKVRMISCSCSYRARVFLYSSRAITHLLHLATGLRNTECRLSTLCECQSAF